MASSSTLPTDTVSTGPKQHSVLVKELIQAGGELFGTFLFIFLAFATIQASLPVQGPLFNLFVALGFGVGLLLAIALTYRISGGVLNPAITIALAALRLFSLRKSALYIVAQLLGAMAATGLTSLLFPGPTKGANVIVNPAFTAVQVVFLEAIATCVLVASVLFLAVEKSRVTFLAPVFIALTVFLDHIILIPIDNASLNPARSFAASLTTNTWDSHWIFWVGPILGGLIAAAIYKIFKVARYEQLNPNQDASE
ncbi:aquaporin-like protein [Polychytrium aggregatum]|uniref:aquaporin-like protein n=1 Tax=Polychytrium aggregatum TaxID=110093 RepID=UPI0022FEC346|nr:aquaporin-like protein [Polychytrium aggregatum]KAI9203158.1 aquaporin-like protein [Polychytrium aggregatum]